MEDNIIKADEDIIKSNLQFAQRSITIIVTAINAYIASGIAIEYVKENEVLMASCIGLSAIISNVIVDYLFSKKLESIMFWMTCILGIFFTFLGVSHENLYAELNGINSFLYMFIILLLSLFLIHRPVALFCTNKINTYTSDWVKDRLKLRIGMVLIGISLFFAISLSNYIFHTYKEVYILYEKKVLLNIGWIFSIFYFLFIAIFIIVLTIWYDLLKWSRISNKE